MTEWRYFEDLAVGETVESEPFTLERDEMIAFASRYDPQWFHNDEAAAADHKVFEGLVPAASIRRRSGGCWTTRCSAT